MDTHPWRPQGVAHTAPLVTTRGGSQRVGEHIVPLCMHAYAGQPTMYRRKLSSCFCRVCLFVLLMLGYLGSEGKHALAYRPMAGRQTSKANVRMRGSSALENRPERHSGTQFHKVNCALGRQFTYTTSGTESQPVG